MQSGDRSWIDRAVPGSSGRWCGSRALLEDSERGGDGGRVGTRQNLAQGRGSINKCLSVCCRMEVGLELRELRLSREDWKDLRGRF